MSYATHAVAGFEATYRRTNRDHFARRLATQLLRQRKWRASWNLIPGEIACAVFYVPTRHRTGEILDQDIMRAKRRQIVFGVDQLLRSAILEQADRHGLGRHAHLAD